MFIARCIYDGDLNSMYILHAELFNDEDEIQFQILKSVVSYLTLFPMETHVGNIWKSAISNQELCVKFDEIVKDVLDGTPNSQTSQQLKDLDCPFYHHEFFKRLVLATIEPGDEMPQVELKNFLEDTINVGILSKSQLDVGVKNAHLQVMKLAVNDATVGERFETLVKECLNNLQFVHE